MEDKILRILGLLFMQAGGLLVWFGEVLLGEKFYETLQLETIVYGEMFPLQKVNQLVLGAMTFANIPIEKWQENLQLSESFEVIGISFFAIGLIVYFYGKWLRP